MTVVSKCGCKVFFLLEIKYIYFKYLICYKAFWGGIIDPMYKWRQFKYSFVYIQIIPTSLILGNIFF